MGATVSSTERAKLEANARIEADIRKQKRKRALTKKILLLGAGDSGKSTVLKQMRVDDAQLFNAIKKLWKDSGVQQCFARSNEFQLMDSAKYYLDAIDRISEADYSPTLDDILHCRVKTTGIAEVCFKMRSLNFTIMDVGGQRSERRKWIRCFEGVNAILFVAAISEYNQKLEEDNETNRMVESLDLFRWIAKHRLFVTTPIILFLNKLDLFEEKLKRFPLILAFPDYKGSHSLDECKGKIESEYLAVNRVSPDRDIYPHFTCATDTTQISFIIDSVIISMIESNLKQSSLS